jgi:hypothetical protein
MRWNILAVFILACTICGSGDANVTAVSIFVRGQVDLPIGEGLHIELLPEEPPIKGGILSDFPETQLELRPSKEKLNSIPQDSPVDGNCTSLEY